MAVPIHVGDVGTIVRLRIREDGAVKNMAAASGITILITKPSGTVVEETATLSTDGTDGRVQYTVEAGVLSEPGVYEVRASFTLGGWVGLTTEALLPVRAA